MDNPFATLTGPLFFAGVGNSLKGDDGAGPRAADRLGEAGIPALNCGELPENYLRQIMSHRTGTIVFIDAVDMRAPAGTIRLFSADEIEITGVFTHGMSLSLLIDLIHEETKVPVYLIGIQPKRVSLGEGLSAEVENGVDKLLQLIVEITHKGR